jgi:elongation factor P
MDIEDISKNKKILIDGIPYNVIDAEFVKPGKGRAIYRLKLRNLLDGSTLDRTYHSGDTVEEVHITSVEEQFLYKEGNHYIFMNTETFEQNFVDESLIGDKKNFLKEGTIVTVQKMGEKPIDISLPITVDLAVVESAVTTKTDTITAQMKEVVLETGLHIGVPTFIKEGDIVRVDTRSGNYVERVSTKK